MDMQSSNFGIVGPQIGLPVSGTSTFATSQPSGEAPAASASLRPAWLDLGLAVICLIVSVLAWRWARRSK